MAASLTNWAGRIGRLVPRGMPERGSLRYVGWTVGWFVFFLLITFPHDIIVRHWTDDVAARSGWQVRFDEVWLRPWNGYHLSNVALIAPGKDTDPWVTADEVVLRPSLLALVGGEVMPVSFSGEAYGGEFEGSVNSPSHVRLAWRGLRLGNYPRLTRLVEGSWAGEISGEAEVDGKGDLRTLEGKGTIHLKDGALTQGKVKGFTVPDLHFAGGDGEVELKGGRLEIRTLKLSGSELDGELRGQILLIAAGNQPVVNGTLSLKPIPGAATNLEPLLTLWNKNQRPATGTYSFTISGPLTSPRLR